MVTKFDQWLAKPTTLQLLRSLLKFDDARIRLPCCYLSSSQRCRSARRTSTFAPFLSLRQGTEDDIKQDNVKRDNVEQDDAKQSDAKHDDDRQGDFKEGEKKHNRKITMISPWSSTRLPHEALDVESLNLQLSVAGVVVMNKELLSNKSFPHLRRQASVNSDRDLGKLLVDDPANKDNAELWAEILQFRHRIDGLSGVVDVWHGMQRRGFDLPLQGREADIMWTTFIRASLSKKPDKNMQIWNFLTEIFDYAVKLKSRTGLHYEGLYKCIIGSLLRSTFSTASRSVKSWNKQLADASFRSREDVARIVEDALMSPHRARALNSLKTIYLTSGYRDLYDSCITEALIVGDEAAALGLHQLFLEKGDEPSTQMLAAPEVQRLFELDKYPYLPLRTTPETRGTGVQSKELASVKAQLARIDGASMPLALAEASGIENRNLSDHFCARLIATRAFSLSFVIQALSMFTVEYLGPLAVRELVSRAKSPSELVEQLKDIKTHGMSLTDHVYCQLVSKIAIEDITAVWDVLQTSDQHAESYSDTATQEALLAMFLQEHRWSEAHMSLLALSLSGSHGSLHGWNVLLQHYARNDEYRPMLSTFQSMQTQGLPFTIGTVGNIFQSVLPERAQGRRYIKGRVPLFFDPVNFVLKALMYASEHGASVPSRMWTELLKRLGMEHQWDDVERLVLWLVDHYSIDTSARLLGLSNHRFPHRKRILCRHAMLRYIFTPNMRRALLAWGFRSASVRRQLRITPCREEGTEAKDIASHESSVEPWAKGLALLKILNATDSTFSIREAKDAFKLRMWILFGPAYSTLGVNNDARRVNDLTLAHYIRHADEVWPGMASELNPALLKNAASSPRQLYFAFFGAFRRVSRKRREYVDTAAWLSQHPATPTAQSYLEKRLTPGKQAQWERHKFPIRRIMLSKKSAQLEFIVARHRPSDLRLQERRSRAAHLASLSPLPNQLCNPEPS